MRKFLAGFGLLAGLFVLSVLSATLTVNLASRGEEVQVPDLVGLGIVPAMEELERQGLALKISGKENSDTLPVGSIISQQPPAGSLIRKGRGVEALISVGPRKLGVPDVRGDFVMRAQSILLENSLRLGVVSRVSSKLWPRDTVVSQSPAPPAYADKNAAVDLLVSSGPAQAVYVMPDLIGRPLADTVRVVQEAGLVISRVGYQDYPGVRPGTVIGQKPPLGTPVGQADAIELVVSKDRWASDRSKSGYSLLSFYVPEGFRPRRVKVVIEGRRGTYEALDESRPPGDRVQVLVETDGQTRALIYIDDRLHDTRYY